MKLLQYIWGVQQQYCKNVHICRPHLLLYQFCVFIHQTEHKTAEEICATHGLNNLEIEYTDEDYETLTNYRAFTTTIRPLVAVENPKVPMAKIVSLIGAKWREYIATHPNPDVLEKGKKAKPAESKIDNISRS